MRTAQQQNSPADASTVTGNTAQITLSPQHATCY